MWQEKCAIQILHFAFGFYGLDLVPSSSHFWTKFYVQPLIFPSKILWISRAVKSHKLSVEKPNRAKSVTSVSSQVIKPVRSHEEKERPDWASSASDGDHHHHLRLRRRTGPGKRSYPASSAVVLENIFFLVNSINWKPHPNLFSSSCSTVLQYIQLSSFL